MRVITFFKTIDLDNYNTINYDYDRLMVSFEAHSEFEDRRLAEEFLDEIYEALESGFDEVNLRAHPLYYKTVNLKGLKEYIKKLDQR